MASAFHVHAKVVSASGGIGWICRSLIGRFGHIPSFESFGRMLAVFAVLAVVHAVIDLVKHLRQFLRNKKVETGKTCGSRFLRKKPSDVGLKHEVPSLWYCFVTAFYENQSPKHISNVDMVTISKSDLNAIAVASNIVVFSLIGIGFPLCHLSLGYQWLIQLQDTFPKIMQKAAYSYLVITLVNNVGGFAVTLVKIFPSFHFDETLFRGFGRVFGISLR